MPPIEASLWPNFDFDSVVYYLLLLFQLGRGVPEARSRRHVHQENIQRWDPGIVPRWNAPKRLRPRSTKICSNFGSTTWRSAGLRFCLWQSSSRCGGGAAATPPRNFKQGEPIAIRPSRLNHFRCSRCRQHLRPCRRLNSISRFTR